MIFVECRFIRNFAHQEFFFCRDVIATQIITTPLLHTHSMMTTETAKTTDLAVNICNLNYSFGPQKPILNQLNLQLPSASRCLLVGLNGAGKTTLLRILAGKRMVSDQKSTVEILGRDAYHDTPDGVTYLGPEWAANPVVRRDVSVKDLLNSADADQYPDRRDELIRLLDVDPEWHMHQISDGERRRVQILLGMIKPFRVLLLDEVTVDLDVVVRRNLLDFLRAQKATIVYATHIFDGLNDWPTHLAHICGGTVVQLEECDKLAELSDVGKIARNSFDSPLLTLVEQWLREDFEKDRMTARRKLDRAPSRWDELSENTRKYGDKYYNYWS